MRPSSFLFEKIAPFFFQTMPKLHKEDVFVKRLREILKETRVDDLSRLNASLSMREIHRNGAPTNVLNGGGGDGGIEGDRQQHQQQQQQEEEHQQ